MNPEILKRKKKMNNHQIDIPINKNFTKAQMHQFNYQIQQGFVQSPNQNKKQSTDHHYTPITQTVYKSPTNAKQYISHQQTPIMIY